MKKILPLFLFTFSLSSVLVAQTAAGNAFRIDYEEFIENNEIKLFNCGNAEMLNTGNEITVMTWAQLRSTNDDQKFIGKYDLNDSGFSFGVIQGGVYPAVWNPNAYLEFGGITIPEGEHWYHYAFTYEAGEFLRMYINGNLMEEHPVEDSPITPNMNDMIIGVASWANNSSFQVFGNLDEMSVFNVALSGDQIRQQMFKAISADDDGLVAAYNFNENEGNVLEDISGNENNGVGSDNFTGSEWVSSFAPMASAEMSETLDLNCMWNGRTLIDPRFTTTTHGMNLIASNMDNEAYAVFGHDGGAGNTTTDIPSNAPNNFMRSTRIWSMNEEGGLESSVIVNLEMAAGGGALIAADEAPENYTLLWRNFGETEFVALASGSTFENNVVTFEGVSLISGNYAIGVGDEPMTSVSELTENSISIYPNPSSGKFTLATKAGSLNGTVLQVFDISGRLVYSEAVSKLSNQSSFVIDITQNGSGMYTLKILNGRNVMTSQIIVE